MAWQDREREWENLRAVQAKLGEISMIWAALDRDLDAILTDMLDIGPAETAAIVTGILPARKCTIIQRLILLACPSPEWGAEVSSILSEISGNFGDLRNRVIHDAWRFSVDEIIRLDPRARSQFAQSHGQKQLVFDTEHPVTLQELDAWCKRGYEMISRLSELQPVLIPWLVQRRAKLSE